MPNYRRLYVPGGTYFFTVNLHDRHLSLLTDHIDLLRASWRDVEKGHPFETIAVIVLPDHLHFMWRLPTDDHDFSTRIRLLKSGFTRRLSDAYKSTGPKGERKIWQRRFWEHHVRDETDYNRLVDYVHFNPVKHGYVNAPDLWPYSSYPDWIDEGRS